MSLKCIVVLSLAVFGVALAKPSCPRSFSVRLSNYGPTAAKIPITNSHVQTRTVERVPLRTAGCVPRPKTVENTCTCYKTIVKPHIHNQIISVPSVQRVIQTTATPVVEKIHYTATPMEPDCAAFPSAFFPGYTTLGGVQTLFVKPRCPSFVAVPSCSCATNAILV